MYFYNFVDFYSLQISLKAPNPLAIFLSHSIYSSHSYNVAVSLSPGLQQCGRAAT